MKNILKSDFLSSRVQYIPLERIVPNPHQPRRDFDPEGLQELAASIRQYGVLQPATVRTRGRDYELVAGERRFRAAKLAGLRELPCLIAQVGEEDSALLALMENLQRRDLNYMEEAAAIAQLVQRWGLSQEEAARRLGKSQSAVANKLRLLRLPESVVALLREGELSERHARALLRLTDEEEQLAAAEDHHRPPHERGADGGIHRVAAAGDSDHAAAPPSHLHPQGRAAVSQQSGSLPDDHALGGGERRLRPPGHGGRDPAHHPHPQGAPGRVKTANGHTRKLRFLYDRFHMINSRDGAKAILIGLFQSILFFRKLALLWA